MGLNTLGESAARSAARSPLPGEPNPSKFTVVNAERTMRHVIVTARFDGCTAFGGLKLLVYTDEAFERVAAAGKMDPHFLEHEDCPVARFAPTAEGTALARELVEAMEAHR